MALWLLVSGLPDEPASIVYVFAGLEAHARWGMTSRSRASEATRVWGALQHIVTHVRLAPMGIGPPLQLLSSLHDVTIDVTQHDGVPRLTPALRGLPRRVSCRQPSACWHFSESCVTFLGQDTRR